MNHNLGHDFRSIIVYRRELERIHLSVPFSIAPVHVVGEAFSHITDQIVNCFLDALMCERDYSRYDSQGT